MNTVVRVWERPQPRPGLPSTGRCPGEWRGAEGGREREAQPPGGISVGGVLKPPRWDPGAHLGERILDQNSQDVTKLWPMTREEVFLGACIQFI